MFLFFKFSVAALTNKFPHLWDFKRLGLGLTFCLRRTAGESMNGSVGSVDIYNSWHPGHESDENLMSEFCGFELKEHGVKNSPSQAHHPLPCTPKMRSVQGIESPWKSLSWQVCFDCCIVYVWRYLEFLQAPIKVVPRSEWMLFTRPLIAKNRLSELMKSDVSRDSITSKWTVLMLKHVKMTAHLLVWIMPPLVCCAETNRSKPTFVNGGSVERRCAGRSVIFLTLRGFSTFYILHNGE